MPEASFGRAGRAASAAAAYVIAARQLLVKLTSLKLERMLRKPHCGESGCCMTCAASSNMPRVGHQGWAAYAAR